MPVSISVIVSVFGRITLKLLVSKKGLTINKRSFYFKASKDLPAVPQPKSKEKF